MAPKPVMHPPMERYGPMPKRPMSPAGYRKKEYYSMPTQETAFANRVRTVDSVWESLPKMNPLAFLPAQGLAPGASQEVIKGTRSSWDARGEHESVKRLMSTTILPNNVEDRIIAGVQQRSATRDLVGIKPMQI